MTAISTTATDTIPATVSELLDGAQCLICQRWNTLTCAVGPQDRLEAYCWACGATARHIELQAALVRDEQRRREGAA